MPHVKIDLEAWLNELIDAIAMHDDVEVEYANEILPLYREWAEKHYEGWTVPPARDAADAFVIEGYYMLRYNEDTFLMRQLKTRSTLMTDEEWAQYCKEKGAIVYGNHYACLSDGFTDNYKPETQQ